MAPPRSWSTVAATVLESSQKRMVCDLGRAWERQVAASKYTLDDSGICLQPLDMHWVSVYDGESDEKDEDEEMLLRKLELFIDANAFERNTSTMAEQFGTRNSAQIILGPNVSLDDMIRQFDTVDTESRDVQNDESTCMRDEDYSWPSWSQD